MASDVSLAAALAAGTLSFLSPCVLPLVPPYLVYLAGTSLERLEDAEPEVLVRRDTVVAAALFVLGFSTVFILLGAGASVAGGLVRAYSNELAIIAGIAIIVMGLHFLGLTRISWLMREKRAAMPKPVGLWGAYGMGLAFAFGWTPCIGPILAAILAIAASEATLAKGAGLLAVYSLGLGIPFLLAALAGRGGRASSEARCGPGEGHVASVMRAPLTRLACVRSFGTLSPPGAGRGKGSRRRAGELGVAAVLVPLVDDVVDDFDVALGVVGDLAEHRIPGAGLERRRDLLGVGRAGLLDRVRPLLDRRIGVECVALGIDALVLELLDHRGGGRLLARVGPEGEQHAFAGRPGDRPELVGRDRIARDHLRLHALVAHLAKDQPGLRVVAADVDHIDRSCLELRHQRIEVLVALGIGLVELLLHAGLVERLLGLVGQAFAVGRLVLKTRAVLALVVLGHEVAGDRALLVVAAADPERVPQAAVREGWIGRGRGDLQHVALGIGLGGRDRGRRAIMAGHEGHPHAAEFFADGSGLLGIAGVIADLDGELLAHHAARRIDVGQGHLGAVLELLPERSILARHRAGHADLDGVLCERCARKRHAGGEYEAGKPQIFHAPLPE